MSSFEPNKRHLRELLIYFFNLKKSAAEALQLLVETYCEAALRGSSHENLKKATKRVFRGSGGLVVSTGSNRLGIDLCKFCYDLIVSYKNFEARFLKTTFFKLLCRITQKVFNRLTSTTFYFVDNKQLLYMNHRYS